MINDLLWRESQLGHSSFQKDILIQFIKLLGFETKDHERESNQIQKCVPLVNLLLSINPSLQELEASDDYSIDIIITCMGTKIIERITTNSFGLKSLDRSGFIRFGVNGQRKSSKETLTDDKEEEEEEEVFFIRSMDKFLEKQNAESIRHTMQAQEDTFKQQVRELHRVYNIQKKMMDQLKHRSHNNQDQTGPRERTGSWSGTDLEHVVRATNTTTDHIEERELELTLSIGMSSSSTNKDMDYSSTTSFRSSSDNCNNQNNNNNNNNSSINNQESSGPNTPMSSSSTTSLDREKKRPHWLFQGLSINRTS